MVEILKWWIHNKILQHIAWQLVPKRKLCTCVIVAFPSKNYIYIYIYINIIYILYILCVLYICIISWDVERFIEWETSNPCKHGVTDVKVAMMMMMILCIIYIIYIYIICTLCRLVSLHFTVFDLFLLSAYPIFSRS